MNFEDAAVELTIEVIDDKYTPGRTKIPAQVAVMADGLVKLQLSDFAIPAHLSINEARMLGHLLLAVTAEY
jgi:hypothetical protein